MELNEDEVNQYLRPLLGQYEDSFQEAWLEILEHKARNSDKIKPIAMKVKNRAITEYLRKKYKEKSLHAPLGHDGNGTFTLESILHQSPTDENEDDGREATLRLYRKIVDFMIGEYVSQKDELSELKRKDVELRERRLRAREQWLAFRKERYQSWKKLMEEKGREKERRLALRIQLQRERFDFQREQAVLRASPKTRRRG